MHCFIIHIEIVTYFLMLYGRSSDCTVLVENAFLMIQMVFLHDHYLNAFTKDRYTTFVHIISFDVACVGM